MQSPPAGPQAVLSEGLAGWGEPSVCEALWSWIILLCKKSIWFGFGIDHHYKAGDSWNADIFTHPKFHSSDLISLK